ncbi:MAG: LytTR family DNA-binding domain-containing protein [Niabella sp.]
MNPGNTYRCIIVDDDEIDRLTVLSFVKKYPFLSVSGVYESAEAALAEIDRSCPQVLFLDVDMDGISGLEMRKELLHADACIFITSYPDYAVESFELAALDFLVKPIKATRFAATMERLQEYMALRQKSALFDHSLNGDILFIKDGHEHVKIKRSDILYLEALKDYTRIVTRQKKYAVYASLGNLLKDSAYASFIRVHRSYAVQKNYIDTIAAQDVIVMDIKIPVGRSYKEAVEALVR